ncbi:MEGF8 protein, partial [Podargus strigoides]|nr:MEGF8 protein [Podargus strigoides]
GGVCGVGCGGLCGAAGCRGADPFPQGAQCERCQPLFVGSARGGGSCRPCRSFCRLNAAVCVTREELERARRDPARFPLD